MLQQPLTRMALVVCLLQQSSQKAIQQWRYKRTRQGALTILLLYLYKYSVVCATIIFTSPNVHASSSYPITHPPCFYLKATIPCLCALTSYSLISITIHTLCVHHEEPMSLDITPNPNSYSRLFPILLDPKSFQTTLDYSSFYHMISRLYALPLLQTITNKILTDCDT